MFNTPPAETFTELVNAWQRTASNLGTDEGGLVVASEKHAVVTIPNDRTGAVMRYEAKLTTDALYVDMSIWVDAQLDERFPHHVHNIEGMFQFFAYAIAFTAEVQTKMWEVFGE